MWSVDKATHEEAQQILAVQREAFADSQRRYHTPLPELSETEEQIHAEIEANRVYVAREGERVIGALHLTVQGEVAHVSHLAVLPEFAHLAVGRSLMARAEEVACRLGASRLELLTRLRDAPAIEFYLKLGYRPVGLLPDEVHQQDQVQFVKSLAV